MHQIQRRPIRWLVCRQSSPNWIDAERKQPVELRVKAFQAKDVLMQQIPVKGFQVPDVKYDPVPLRNGPVVDRVRPDNVEQHIASASRIDHSLQQEMSADIGWRTEHSYLLAKLPGTKRRTDLQL